MLDIRLIWDPQQGRADVQLVNGQLDTSEVLATWVIVSLFTDRRAEASDQLPSGVTDRRGWWGDSYADNPGDRFGSRLWLLARARSNASLPLIARGYILEALQWLIDDGIAAAVDAVCAFAPNTQSRLDAVVTITRGDGTELAFPFDNLWQEIAQAA
jgi:phage gp46-like protein